MCVVQSAANSQWDMVLDHKWESALQLSDGEQSFIQSTACKRQVCANLALAVWFRKQAQRAQLMQDEHGMHSVFF